MGCFLAFNGCHSIHRHYEVLNPERRLMFGLRVFFGDGGYEVRVKKPIFNSCKFQIESLQSSTFIAVITEALSIKEYRTSDIFRGLNIVEFL